MALALPLRVEFNEFEQKTRFGSSFIKKRVASASQAGQKAGDWAPFSGDKSTKKKLFTVRALAFVLLLLPKAIGHFAWHFTGRYKVPTYLQHFMGLSLRLKPGIRSFCDLRITLMDLLLIVVDARIHREHLKDLSYFDCREDTLSVSAL